MRIDTGMTGREALEILARERGTTPDAVLESEIAASRALSGRGALYRTILLDGGSQGKPKKFYRSAL